MSSGRFDPRIIETGVVEFDDTAEALAGTFTKVAVVRD